MRTILVLVLLLACKKAEPPELKVTCGATSKPLEQTRWQQLDLLAIRDGTETQVCTADYSVSLYYANRPVEPIVKRVTDLLAAKGYREVDPAKATHVQVSGGGGIPVRVFVNGGNQVSLSGTTFPDNKGAPFELELGLFTTGP